MPKQLSQTRPARCSWVLGEAPGRDKLHWPQYGMARHGTDLPQGARAGWEECAELNFGCRRREWLAQPLATKAVPWLATHDGQLNVSPEVLAASVGPRGLLALLQEGLPQGLEHRSASFATGGAICPVPSESSDLPRTDRRGALFPFLLRQEVLATGEVSQERLLALQLMSTF